MPNKAHSLQLNQESLTQLMKVKRFLKSTYNIQIHLQDANLGEHLADAVRETHDENVYQMISNIWEELSQESLSSDALKELKKNRSSLETAWKQDQSLH